ncbi:glycerol-3-phosphate O-acyltransferase [Coprinopsis marcescibilis]|uniref:Glycerol-3-phosphate O-acyltransferase n=1 Tax=Coprinopsis marcescibilis TaxID=230819 RepID=A0A5C3LAS6_COPMA|nr:glycerol-3-phosphate O-acyltransferase [Coprinopsis marcescibilis]
MSSSKKVVSASPIPYEAVMVFWRMVTQIFFREIRPRGAFNIPRSGPVIFVAAPHNNQFLDPLLLSLEVWRETHRSVQFLAAAKSMKRSDVGFFIKMMNSIPVERAADSLERGQGYIWISPDDPCLVYGEGTEFTKHFSPRMQIMLPKSFDSALAEVTEVISDSLLRIKREFGGESGKITARLREKVTELRKEGIPGLEYQKLPFVDQQEMYRHVYQALKNGGSIGIFPEGGSHDRTDLLPLKAGVSIMALGAMASDSTVQVKIVPVGLSYFHAHRFRSRAVVEFGAAIDIPSEFVDMFKEGGVKKRDAVAKLLDLIYDSLKTVTVRAPDYDTLMLIQAVRRLYKTPGQHLTLSQVIELNRRLLEGYNEFKDEPRVQKLRADVLKYNRLVRDLGLRDHQVPRAQRAGWKTFGLLTYRLLLLLVWTVLALPGTILNGPMFILASIISRKKAKEALAASAVKIAGRDVLATWKVLIALGVTPVLYTLYAIIATLIAVRAKASLPWRIFTPFLTVFSLPFMNYASLKFGEAGMDVLKSLPPLIVALIPGQQRYLDRLKAMRDGLSNEVASLINDFGPRLYDDFNEARILLPSSSAPPSTGTPGLWRRKSSVGAVDAQGLGLIHPMTWLDERLFGWSRSARRGTSAWGGHDDISRVATPDFSEEEDDAGDYDNVAGVLGDDLGLAKTRSRQSSYADLQRLRMSGMSNASSSAVPDQDATLTARNPAGHRKRRESLSDTIPVQRIAQVPGEEPFQEATHDLNEEASHSKST